MEVTADSNKGVITVFFPGIFGKKKIFSITYDGLYKLLSENAENYKRNIFGKTYYMVPQIQNYARANRVGFVASEGKPVYGHTKYPIDFIAICHLPWHNNNDALCRPTVYSTALGLKFKFMGEITPKSDDEGWQIEEMENGDLYDALDDEALEASYSN